MDPAANTTGRTPRIGSMSLAAAISTNAMAASESSRNFPGASITMSSQVIIPSSRACFGGRPIRASCDIARPCRHDGSGQFDEIQSFGQTGRAAIKGSEMVPVCRWDHRTHGISVGPLLRRALSDLPHHFDLDRYTV